MCACLAYGGLPLLPAIQPAVMQVVMPAYPTPGAAPHKTLSESAVNMLKLVCASHRYSCSGKGLGLTCCCCKNEKLYKVLGCQSRHHEVHSEVSTYTAQAAQGNHQPAQQHHHAPHTSTAAVACHRQRVLRCLSRVSCSLCCQAVIVHGIQEASILARLVLVPQHRVPLAEPLLLLLQ
jgi:hypothetical protein